MLNKFDVTIVGASCAGAAAGYALAKGGKNVALIDKATFPRDKLCGGMVTEKTIKLLHNVYGEFPHNEIIDSEYFTYGIYHKDYGKICKFTSDNRRLFLLSASYLMNFFIKRRQPSVAQYSPPKG
jgi:flavin-dependent dehydrogenase